jgi:hypothetical protein
MSKRFDATLTYIDANKLPANERHPVKTVFHHAEDLVTGINVTRGVAVGFYLRDH